MDEIKNQDDAVEERPSKFKRFFIIIIAIFLAVLILSYILINENVKATIQSILISSRLENTTLQIDKSTKLIFNNESLATLNSIYDKNLEKEFKVCLNGKKIDNTYYIEETLQPKTFQQEYNFVVAEPCPSTSLVSLHTHPFKQCIPSQQDIENFKAFKKRNKDALLAVMCSKDLFFFYR